MRDTDTVSAADVPAGERLEGALDNAGGSLRSVVCTPVSVIRQDRRAGRQAAVRATQHVVIFATQGLGSHQVESVKYTIEPGTVIHVQPGQVHRWLRDESYEGWAIAIEPHVCAPGIFDLAAPHPHVRLGPSIDVAKTLVSSLTEPELLPAKAQERLRISIAAVLLELIASAGDGPTVSADLASEYALVSDFRRELEFHYLDTRSVADYASLVGCSTKTLTRATKRLLAQTPKQVIDARVTYAATRLLANTDVSIRWISTKLGFTQQSNFSKFFVRHVGMTPAAYREACNASRLGDTSLR